jgi:hypothetical protein
MRPTLSLTRAERELVDATTEASLQAAARRMTAEADARVPGIGVSTVVREGVDWRATRLHARASVLAEARQRLVIRQLTNAPLAPRFTDGLGLTGTAGHNGSTSQQIGLSIGDNDVMVLIDGVPLIDPAFLDADVDGNHHGGGFLGLPTHRPDSLPGIDPGWQPAEPTPSDGPARGGLHDAADLPGFSPTPPCDAETPPLPCREPEPGETAADGPLAEEVPLIEDDLTAYAYAPTSDRARPCRLVLLLPGKEGRAVNVGGIAKSYAQAGYYVLALDWPTEDCTVRKLCASEEAYLSDVDWQDCVTQKRMDRYLWIVEQTAYALAELDTPLLGRAWGNFLTLTPSGGLGVEWSRVILAGYSEGANQQSFNSRLLPAAGVIYLSGGADAMAPDAADVLDISQACATLAPESDLELGDWVVPMAESRHRVGYVHTDEPFDVAEAWSASGLELTAGVVTDTTSTL